MKKMVMALMALASLNAMAVELQIKGGYDVFRFQSQEKTFYKAGEQLERGFVINTELFPLNHLRVEPGIGIEYNFSNTKPGYGVRENGKENETRYHHIPVYGIVKANIIQKENGDSPLAAVAKLGYAFVQKTKNAENPGSGGLYYGLGVNGEYGPFVVEFLASRTHLLVPLEKAQQTARTVANGNKKLGKGDITKVGLTAGFRIGKLHKDVTPVEEAPVELIEPVVETPQPAPQVEVVEKPEVKVEPTIEQIELQAEALFNFDKSDLDNMLEEGKNQIRELAEVLTKDYVKVQAIQVVGHTDRLGSEKYNMALGQRRANTVKALLQDLGVTADITAISKGESEPKKECKGNKPTKALKDCLLENRRVEINVVGQKFSE